MEVTRTFDLLDRYRELYLQKTDALASKEGGKWVLWSTKDYTEQSDLMSYGLLALGLKKGDMVATISNNRPEWNIIDMGLAQAGIIHVPIYPTISKEDYDYILNHAQPKLVIVSDKQLYNKIKPIVEGAPSIKTIYTIDAVEGANNWKEIINLGKEKEEKFCKELIAIKDSIKPDDMVTVIYTSGTTGFPKGVMLSHNNLVTNFISTTKVHPLNHNHRVLSFLPISHVYERMVNYHFQYKGLSMYYAENMGTIVQDLKDVKPHVFNSVPRLLERVYDRIIGKGKDLPYIKKQLFFWAVNLGMKFDPMGNGPWYNLRLKIARKLIFSKWNEALGGNVQIIVSGGAALQARLACIFWAADMKVLEGYGLTETSPVICVNNLTTMEVKFGTVGPVIENVEVKIAEDGEILCKGPNVMLGYYKAPDLTAEVIDKDGWFHTGDIGVFVDGKYLKITDRKKEIFKLSSGKYIAPQVIENKLKESFFIENLMVIGENEKFASALISPNYEFLHNWAGVHGIKFRDNQELISNPQTIARIQKEVNEMNKNLGQTEHIKRFRLVAEEWTPATGEMSPTLKLKRKVIAEKYKAQIEEIYSVDKGGVD
ncbi:MAG: long-chain fatty acid--CoA ligase [Bacteroidales bacterium]|nr:long-chain fatty acid--CoA ligase [Bacteroidales bacterium]MCB9013432.1 long-chain fatty acid--CoA ligase [Bacteroidales bacterium]